MVPSSSGLGYWPLTPETRVRNPLGLPKKRIKLGYPLKAGFLFVGPSLRTSLPRISEVLLPPDPHNHERLNLWYAPFSYTQMGMICEY
jgi:hypothetical protein